MNGFRETKRAEIIPALKSSSPAVKRQNQFLVVQSHGVRSQRWYRIGNRKSKAEQSSEATMISWRVLIHSIVALSVLNAEGKDPLEAVIVYQLCGKLFSLPYATLHRKCHSHTLTHNKCRSSASDGHVTVFIVEVKCLMVW
jgi:hypothetical protein